MPFALGRTMKKIIPKLVLKRETVRTLVEAELAHAAAGLQENCTAVTQIASGCGSTGMNADLTLG
jgi:hypothetical protein